MGGDLELGATVGRSDIATNNRRSLARRRLASLLVAETGSTFNLATTSVEAASRLLRVSKDSRAHECLNLAISKVTKALVPMKKFLFVISEVAIRFVNSRKGGVESFFRGERNVVVLASEASR